MSDQTTGPVPDEELPVSDTALDTLLSQWVSTSPDTVDVEAALARVTARRLVEAALVRDDLAGRRAARKVIASTPQFWQRSSVRIAATLLMVLGAAAVWRGTRSATVAEYVTGIGGLQEITLTDGTMVRLGPASSLALDAGFGRDHRHLTLHGEAWFKVTHNEKLPFAIRVGTTTVEDVGTAFRVRESSRREVSVRVAEGAVRLTTTAAAHDSTVMLTDLPDAIARLADDPSSAVKVLVDPRE